MGDTDWGTIAIVGGIALLFLTNNPVSKAADNVASNLPWYAAGAAVVYGTVETSEWWLPLVLL